MANPGPLAYMPGLHTTHAEEPVLAAMVPGAQLLQLLDPLVPA